MKIKFLELFIFLTLPHEIFRNLSATHLFCSLFVHLSDRTLDHRHKRNASTDSWDSILEDPLESKSRTYSDVISEIVTSFFARAKMHSIVL